MKRYSGTALILLFQLPLILLNAQIIQEDSARYVKPGYFTEKDIVVDTGVVYGEATDWKGNRDVQKFNIFYPADRVETCNARPFILLFHGGGYHEEDEFCNRNQWNSLCMMLACRGFVAATVDYRVGWNDNGEEPDNDASGVQKLEPTSIFALYRALQDSRAALRYFSANAFRYKIDPDNIFIGGRSAGGDISLWNAFTNQHELDSMIMEFIPEGCHSILGSLDSSTNDISAKYRIRGVINMWGPIADTVFISPEEAFATPIIMFHGTDDRAVPYKMFAPPDYAYKRMGSFYIAERYRHLGAHYELNTKTGGGHGEDFSDEFLAEHISAFFNNVMDGKTVSAEYASEVSFGWKLQMFCEWDGWPNIIPVIALLLTAWLILRRFRNKRKPENPKI